MFTRMAVLYTPFLLVLSFWNAPEDLAYYVFVGVEVAFAIVNLAFSIKLIFMRHELRSTLLDETIALFFYAVVAFTEVVYSNTVYILASQAGDQKLILFYIYGDLIFVTIMWLLTGGKAVLIVWRQPPERVKNELDLEKIRHQQTQYENRSSQQSVSLV